MSTDSEPVDLLGEPICEPEEMRGRPSHIPDDEKRNKVSILRASGFEVTEIAIVLEVSEKTLRKYYFLELEQGALKKKAAIAVKLFELGQSGSVPALKAFEAKLERGEALPPPKPEHTEAPEKLGKKEQAELDAKSAHKDTIWSGLLN